MSTLSLAALRDAYDQQVRRNATPDGSGATASTGATWVRWSANEGLGWSEISWSQLTAADADEAIAAQIDYFRARGQSFVWRLYDYDTPADLGTRLLAAGLTYSDQSAVMIAESASLTHSSPLPEGTELLHVRDEEGIDLLISTHEEVFEHDHQDLRRSLIARLRRAPEEFEMFVVLAKGVPVCAARVEFSPQREFAALWGGGTTPEWRGRGIYKALVSIRARRALEKGYAYLMVMASDQSRPILSRLGFETIANVATYSWEPTT